MPDTRFNEAWINRDIRRLSIDLFLYQRTRMGGEERLVGLENIVVKEFPVGVSSEEPKPISLSYEVAQQIAEELWVAGIKPSHASLVGEQAITREYIASLKSEIEFLRATVNHYLGRI